jgi:cytochrome c oxidase subunit 3
MAPGSVKHDYHLVDPSPWPVVGALGAFIMMVGAAFWLNKTYAGFGVLAGIPWIFAIGLALVLFTMTGWWRDVVTESVVEGAHAPVVKLSLRYGMALFIVSDVMFFVVWFWAWFNFALFPHDAGLTGWPPAGIVPLDPWQLPLLGTVILLVSATTVTWAQHGIQTGNKRGTVLALSLTVVLGISFTALLAYIGAQAPFSFGFNGAALAALTDPAHASLAVGQGNLGAIYGSTFFMATGVLGVHVAVGTVFLAVCLGRTIRGHFTSARHFGFEAAAWYWHFVVAIWLILFTAVFVFGRG